MAQKSMGSVVAEIRRLTMACWWPSRYTGKQQTDWAGIAGELDALCKGAAARLDYGTSTPQELLRLQELRQWANGKVDEIAMYGS